MVYRGYIEAAKGGLGFYQRAPCIPRLLDLDLLQGPASCRTFCEPCECRPAVVEDSSRSLKQLFNYN